jgi:hypothetical protein
MLCIFTTVGTSAAYDMQLNHISTNCPDSNLVGQII